MCEREICTHRYMFHLRAFSQSVATAAAAPLYGSDNNDSDDCIPTPANEYKFNYVDVKLIE